MARVFKPTYTAKGRDGQRITKTARKWYVEYRDADGIIRRVPGFTDKAATQQRASELERQAAHRKVGLIDRFSEHRKRPLPEHVEEWRKALIAKGGTAQHAALSANRVKAILTATKATYWPELSASKVQAYLAEQRQTKSGKRRVGLSVESANHYLRAVKAFCRWMVLDGRAPDTPLAHLETGNAKTDRRHDRRALTADELAWLLDTTRNASDCYGVGGTDRAMLYRVAVETGLRAGELRSLTVGSFDLDAERPTVTVRAAYSKRRETDVLPIRLEVRDALREHFASKLPKAEAFRMPSKSNVVRMLRKDLSTARAAWIDGAKDNPAEQETRRKSDFLNYADQEGRVADFHAFRHTFITNLAYGGVHPKTAQALARHSTIGLTMDRYTHTRFGDLSDALDVLPDLDAPPIGTVRQKANGTDGEPLDAVAERPRTDGDRSRPEQGEQGSEFLGVLLGVSLAETAAGKSRPDSASDGRQVKCQSDDIERKTNKSKGLDGNRRNPSASDLQDSGMGRAGIEPATHGFSVRCSTN